jgi:hypothetical protein
MTMISKIANRHLSRQACIYVRQSTLAQVRSNQESTDRAAPVQPRPRAGRYVTPNVSSRDGQRASGAAPFGAASPMRSPGRPRP